MSETATDHVSDETAVVRQNRRERRLDTSWSGLIRLPEGKEVACIVRDISKSGARLSIPPNVPLANAFYLKIEERGFVFAVSLRWRRGSHAGVRIERMAKIDVDAASAGDRSSDSSS